MPFVSPKRPSIGLGLLKASLLRAGVACSVDYANLEFVKQVGLIEYLRIAAHTSISILGEWVFAGTLFPDFHPNHDRFFRDWIDTAQSGRRDQDLQASAWRLREFATTFVEETAQRLVGKRPKLIGCSSTFVQHCASLALLKRVKELDPTIVTVMGGANCDGRMGITTKEQFPWVDYVFSGEADEALVDLARCVLEGKSYPHPTIRFTVQNVKELPRPDYDDYFATLSKLGLDKDIDPCIPLETSRGCWWGQKHHCTFCGLNGGGMQFRRKPADKAVEDLRFLSDRHGSREVLMVDKIMDMAYVKTFLPRLAEEPERYKIFYETKANLQKEHLETMARAGVTFIQAGVESLNDDLLELMDKGTTGLENLQLLKWSREIGIHVTWLMLFGFPGDQTPWYEQIASVVPWVVHLQPPNGLVQVGYHRFSPYFEQADRYGLSLESDPGYSYVYPFDEEVKKNLVYNFVDRADLADPRRRAWKAQELLREPLQRWVRQFWGGAPALLCMDEEDGIITILDTRPGAPRRVSTHQGIARDILIHCDSIAKEKELLEKFGAAAGPELKRLVDLRLILRDKDKLLALPTRGSLPTLRRQIPTGRFKVPTLL